MFDIGEIAKLIEDNRNKGVEFGATEDGASEEWLVKAEQRLQAKLPPSYRWFLENYGGGDICGEEIYSIYGMDFDEVSGGDVVAQYLAHQQTKTLHPKEIPISANDFGEVYVLKSDEPDHDGEYCVYLVRGKKRDRYAENFADFLKLRIRQLCG